MGLGRGQGGRDERGYFSSPDPPPSGLPACRREPSSALRRLGLRAGDGPTRPRCRRTPAGASLPSPLPAGPRPPPPAALPTGCPPEAPPSPWEPRRVPSETLGKWRSGIHTSMPSGLPRSLSQPGKAVPKERDFPRGFGLGAAEAQNFLGKSSEEGRMKSFWDGFNAW